MARYKINNKTSPKSDSPAFKDKLPGATDVIDNLSSLNIEETNISEVEDLVVLDLEETTISKSFGRPEDVIELHIYSISNELLLSEYDFEDYEFPEGEDNETSSEILIDYKNVLETRGFISGKYKLKFNLHRHKIFNSSLFDSNQGEAIPLYPFQIKEIDPTKTEIRSISKKAENNVLDSAVNKFISELGTSSYFQEFALNFGDDIIIPAVNILLNKDSLAHEVFIRTLDPLPNEIKKEREFKVVEEIVDGFFVEIDMGQLEVTDDTIELMGPNFNIDTKTHSSIPSAYKTYNDLLEYNISSSYDKLLNKLENKEIPEIHYDHIRKVSSSLEDTDIPYHFENFVHFSSAEERLNNFKYKLELIELYTSQSAEIDTIIGSTSGSRFIKDNKKVITDKKQNLIKGFDGYEQFLYNTTGSNLYTWPKINAEGDLYSVSSSEAIEWLGFNFSKDNASGQLLSASLYDKSNPYNLNKLIPEHIKNNTNNTLYVGFVNMIGQHFDYLWSHIKHITELNNHHNKRGISKELVYFQLKSLGIETFDQFENADLIEYILGEGKIDHTVGNLIIGDYIVGGLGKEWYNVKDHQTLVTASYGGSPIHHGSVPKGEITREIWKRLYHNAPYLLQTKGTERGIKALMSCYGLPSTILNIKEYGGSTSFSGPIKDINFAEFYKTFSYEKSGLALHGDSGTTGHFVKINWSSSIADDHYTNVQQQQKSVEFRIKPVRLEENYHLFSLSGSNNTGAPDVNLAARDNHLILCPYTGSDISSSGDSKQFGEIHLYQGSTFIASSSNFPVYNDKFWNVFLRANKDPDSNDAQVTFGAYQANFNKNIFSYVTSSHTSLYSFAWGTGKKGAKYAYFGGIPSNPAATYNVVDSLRYSGSLQGIRVYFGELISDVTLKKHALEPYMYGGNSISSSFENLILRLPLGSNDFESSGSFHPNENLDHLLAFENTGVGYSSIGTTFTVGGYGIGSQVTSNMSSQRFEEVIETHFLPTPDTVGASTTSEKVRIDTGTIPGNILMPNKKLETSTLDRQPPEYEDLGIFFSPTEEINEDIIYTLGSFRMDDYIGSPLPSAQSASVYEDLSDLSDVYFQKIQTKYNYWDYIKLIQQIDHTLFKIIEQWVPFKANTKTGLLIEPHFLERNKFPREIPKRSDGQTMTEGLHQHFDFAISTDYEDNKINDIADTADPLTPQGQYEPGTYVVSYNNLSNITSSKTGERLEQGTNTTIEIFDDHLSQDRIDPNAENQQACQAPIKPYGPQSYENIGIGYATIGTTFAIGEWTTHIHPSNKPDNYIAHESSILLGMATKGRSSRRYYRYPQYNNI